MAKSKPAQPGSVKPNMHKMFDGRNIATRPIPVIHDSSDNRAIEAAAIDQRPKGQLVNFPSGPRPNISAVAGSKIKSSPRGGTYNPAGVEDNR